MTILTACHLAVIALAAASAPGEPAIGVIVAKPSGDVTAGQWSHLEALACIPELLSRYTAETPDAAFDFAGLREDLAAFEAHGLPVTLTLTAHLHTTPYVPMHDEDGAIYQQRHNPFDAAFLREWGRMHQAFLDEFGQDPRVHRVYIGPPSYFGETEYFMGPDWAHLKFLAYDPLARQSFIAWLRARYGTVAVLADAWGMPLTAWDDVVPPKPRRNEAVAHTAPDWLDFMRWRTDHLTEIVSAELARLAQGFHGEVGVKVAISDFSATHGVNTAAIAARFPKDRKLALHATNGHSLADLRYFSAIADHYGASSLTIENDGNRFTRTELARILLNFHLAGADTFNFSHLGHFNLEPPTRSSSETSRVLLSMRPWLTRYDLSRRRRPVAFLHSNTTVWVRAPRYRNRDVSRAYDAALSNGAGPEVRAFSWARWLGMPDVTCEDLVLDGDLEGRRLLVIPNSSLTLLPAGVRDRILAWVSAGGTLVLFGPDSFGQVLTETPTRCKPVNTWFFPEIAESQGTLAAEMTPLDHVTATYEATAPVFREAPGPMWRCRVRDAADRPVLVACPVGEGEVYLFAGAVPAHLDGRHNAFHAEVVPRLLHAIALRAGIVFDVEVSTAEEPSAPLALAYLGVDAKSGRHIFAGGAYDGSVPRMTIVPAAELTGPAELLLVDEPRVTARVTRGEVDIACNRPAPGAIYADPTNLEAQLGAYIPCTTVRFELPNRLEIALAPSL